MVFTSFFGAGLRLPYDDFLPSVLEMYEKRLPQLNPSAIAKLSVFAWMCRMTGFAPTTELFTLLFTASTSTKDMNTPIKPKKTVFDCVNFNLRPEHSDSWLVPASMPKWDWFWMQKWFYITNTYATNLDNAVRLRFCRLPISINSKLNVEVDGTLESRLILLRKVERCLSTRDLCEEYCMLQIALPPCTRLGGRSEGGRGRVRPSTTRSSRGDQP